MSDGEAEGDVTEGNGDVAEAAGDVADAESDVADAESDVADAESDDADAESDDADAESDDAEAESADDVAPARGREVWIEKYRPERLEDVLGHGHITERLEEYVERNDIPHLLFAGPAGTGKCVTGETPVLTNRGVERMEDVVGETEGFSTPDEGLEVLTLDEDGEFRYVEPSHVFGKRTDDFVSVRTRDGADTTVTPEHKLLVLGDDGPNWKRAADLSPGERLARPRSVPLATGDSTLDWTTALDGERTLVRVTEEFAAEYGIPVEEDRPGRKKAGVVGFREGSDGGEIATTAGTTKTTVRTSRRQSADTDLDEPSAVCSLSDLRELDVHRDELKRHVTGIQYVSRDDERSRPITPPWSVTPALATFVGLAVSEARIDGGEITVVNGDERVLERFEETARELFDVDPERGENGGVPSVHVESGSLTHYLNACFDVFAGATGRGGIGSALVGADRESRSAFLRAVFDGAADVDSDEPVELTYENGDLITLLSYLLAGFGISTRRSIRSKAATNGSGRKREYHVLSLSGADNLSRFRDCVGFTVDRNAERVARNAARTLHPVTSADLYYDEVESVEREPGERRVYDLTVPGTRNYVAGRVPTVMHNTTCAVAIARELYGDDWQENFLELNASDERGIDVVRERIKNFARASFGGYDHRIIFLDEADALTSDAQAALRRTMEQYSNNTRFFLSCNYSSDIIDPIQSRCTVFRFSPLEDPAVAEQIRRIADEEDIEITEDGLEALIYVADGDMRKAINRLQAAAVMGETVDEDTVFEITSAVKPEEIRELVERALAGDFSQARSQLDDMLTHAGVAGGDVIDQIHRSVWEFDLDDDEAVRLMERVGEADYRITAGANEQVQLEALLASLALDEDD